MITVLKVVVLSFLTITSMLKVPSIIDKIEQCTRIKPKIQEMLIM